MPQVPAQSFYLGPFAVYTSDTGMTDPVTGTPYLGGTLHEGDYCDLTRSEAAQWNVRFGSNLDTGRYRFVRVSPLATAANIGYGKPAATGFGQSLRRVVLSAAGSGATTDGTYTISSTASGGTAATATATVASGAITSVQLVFPGSGFTSVPTWGLTEIAGLSGGSVLSQMAYSPNLVGSFDSTSGSADQLTAPRGVFLASITAAQVTANAWMVIQEEGYADVLVTTATATVPGSVATAASGATVTTTTSATAPVAGFLGYTLDTAAASTHVRVELDLPVRQG